MYFSRSRGRLWRKGEQSGNVQHVRELRVDCDGDTILLLVDQRGPACHEGYRSCFFRRIDANGVTIQQARIEEPEHMYGSAAQTRPPGDSVRSVNDLADPPSAPGQNSGGAPSRTPDSPSIGWSVLVGWCCLIGWLAGDAPLLLAQVAPWNSVDRDQALQDMVQTIDARLAERWAAEDVVPAALSNDAEFLRRLSLDVTGVAPNVAELHEFLADADPAKRSRWIDRFTHSPRYATHMAGVWRNILLPGGVDLQQEAAAEQLENWLRRQFHQNLRYDNLVAEFLTANGPANAGPGLFYTSLELKPEKLAASTSRIFLGLQIQCAECHDHPFDHWKQKDFWGYAAFFAQLRGGDQPMASARIADAASGEVTLPELNRGHRAQVPRRLPRIPRKRGTSTSATGDLDGLARQSVPGVRRRQPRLGDHVRPRPGRTSQTTCVHRIPLRTLNYWTT